MAKVAPGVETEPAPSMVTKQNSWRDFGVARRIAFCSAAIMLLVAGGGGWAATAELAGAVISHGSLIVDGRVKKVQHRDGGIVQAVNVKNGDQVQKGQILIRLDDTQTRAELGVIQSQLTELRARQARLRAVRDQAGAIEFEGILKNAANAKGVMKSESQLFLDDRKTRDSQKEQLELRVGQLADEDKGISAQEKAKRLELELIRKELIGVKSLLADRLTPITRVYALEREESKLAGEHGSLLAQGARVRGQINETKLQIINLEQTAKTEAQRELRTVDAKISELIEREIASDDRLSRMEIRAPESGLVHQLQANTIGGIVTSAEPVVLIVPEGNALSVEIKIAPGDVDQIHIGQDVRLRFSSFNQRTTPEVHGAITYVSADVVTDPKGHGDFYTALVKMNDVELNKIGKVAIVPGMPVEAFVMTEKRTALSYFVKPITDQFSRALREE